MIIYIYIYICILSWVWLVILHVYVSIKRRTTTPPPPPPPLLNISGSAPALSSLAKTLRNYNDILHTYAKLQHEKSYIKSITIVNNTISTKWLFTSVP